MQPRYAADFLLKVRRAFIVHRSFKITIFPERANLGRRKCAPSTIRAASTLFYFSGEVHLGDAVGELGWFGGL